MVKGFGLGGYGVLSRRQGLLCNGGGFGVFWGLALFVFFVVRRLFVFYGILCGEVKSVM